MLPSAQSGFHFFHSTETSYLKIYNDSLLSCDKGAICFFLCLYFSSASDAVDHSLLLQQLETSFGISGSCLKWISSYLSNRSSVVSENKFYSDFSFFPLGVFQVLFFVLLFVFFILLNS